MILFDAMVKAATFIAVCAAVYVGLVMYLVMTKG